MNYLEEFEHELRRLLSAGDIEAVIRFAKERLLQSFRNGQASRREAPARGEGKASIAV